MEESRKGKRRDRQASEPRVETPARSNGADFLAEAQVVLRDVFGFAEFRDGQQLALEGLAACRDCVVIMPTGSGKSLCYQIPALVRPGVTLVVSPLIALMKDQVDALVLRGVPATFLNSSLSLDEGWRRLEQMREGAYRLVYVAPERFRNRMFRRALSDVPISLLAVDEAHCISQWGHDFRPDYRRLGDVRRQLDDVVTIALTATATPDVQDDIARELGMDAPLRVVTGFDRPNLSFRVDPVTGGADKRSALERILLEMFERFGSGRPPRGIIYAGTRKHAEEAARIVNDLHLPTAARDEKPLCRVYHAGLDDDERREVQEDFAEGRLPIVAATNAFGMGVDKSDIRFVVHYDLPGSLEAYYQEVGRAGRDGLPARCHLLFSERDRRLQEFFIEGSNPSRETIEGLYEFLWSLGENPIFRSVSLLEAELEASGALPHKTGSMGLRSAMAILERAGALERLDHRENMAEVTPLGDHDWALCPYGGHATVRQRVWDALRRVFERTDREPAGIHLESWAPELGLPEESLRRALAHLAGDGWIRYVPPFRGRAIRLPPAYQPLEQVGVDFVALRARRKRDEERLREMLRFARSRRCRRNLILRHFGERRSSAGCGNCDSCDRKLRSSENTDDTVRRVDGEDLVVVRKILSAVARARGRCGRGRVIQMLLGSRAQALRDLGLDKLTTYGILKGVRRGVVRDLMDELEAAGCITQRGTLYPVVLLTERGVRVMRGEESVELVFPGLSDRPRGGAGRGTRNDSAGDSPMTTRDEDLFQRLRRLRREIASELRVPAFRVFTDKTLRSMSKLRPSDADSLLAVPGVGTRTLERFGTQFLAEIRREEGSEEPGT